MLTTLLDGTAFAERHGAAPARIVALHGWQRDRSDWAATLDGFDALAVDLPGFGATPAPETGWGTKDYADWLAGVLADGAAVAPKPTLVGHSFGGRVAVELAAVHPELVGRLVLTGVPLYRREGTGRPKASYRLARWLNRKGLLGHAAMERQRRRHGSRDYLAAQGVIREVFVKVVNEQYPAQVEAIAAAGIPVDLIWGAGDTTEAPVWNAERAGAVLGVTPTLVEGSQHLLDTGLVAALRASLTREVSA